jgi:DUF1680 family protein
MKRSISFFLVCFSFFIATGQSYVPEKKNTLIKVQPAIPIKAYAFNLRNVKLLTSPFANAMRLDSAYLLLLKPDRLLHRFHKNAGLTVKDSVYGGWESEGLSGHTLGHYLSAMSMMYATTGNIEFKKRTDYTVSELYRCQQARKSGYVGAIPREDSIFSEVAKGNIRSSGFDLNGGWSPWYTVHKLMAGLVDAYLYCGNRQALKVVTGMADWTYATIHHLPDSLRLKMLNCEYGGMNEVLANIYSITGNKKYLDLSYKFYDEFVMAKLAQRIDPLPGKHSNTNVPKAIGSARQYELTANERDKTIASFFWETMVNHHTYTIGGNSNYEYCGKPDSLNDRLSDNTCETCNTYNMLKLTRHLFAWQPSGKLMDYYERALYNHILASQNPTNGMMCYFVPLRMGTKKQFSDSFNTFTCCVGSGIENHSRYAEQVYSHDNNNLYINLFIPSELDWKERGIKLVQETEFPASERVYFTYKGEKSQSFNLFIRKPFWQRGAFRFYMNGTENLGIYSYEGNAGLDRVEGYIPIRVTMRRNDKLEIRLAMDLYTESMPDNPDRIAFKYGPLVLAGLLGKERPDPVYGVPVLLTDNRNIKDWMEPAPEVLRFKTKNVGKPFDVTLVPFYQVYDQYYSVYWDYFTKAQWQQLQEEYEAEKRKQQEIENRTIDYFRIGEMQPERDHNLKASERSYVDDALGRKGREARANNYFSFDMQVDPNLPAALILTYIGDDKDRNFDIVIDGTKVHTVEWKGGKAGKFYDIEYSIPVGLLKNKSKISVRIEANYGKTAGRVFGVRTVLSKPE